MDTRVIPLVSRCPATRQRTLPDDTLRDGFAPTTIAAITGRAGVSAESVYKGFGTKAALAKAVFDLVIAGYDEPEPVAKRPAMRAARDEPTRGARSPCSPAA